MKTAKNSRQEMMLKLIREKDISTQEELTSLVKAAGFNTTQATVSRDIKELGIIKEADQGMIVEEPDPVEEKLNTAMDLGHGKGFGGL